MFIAALFTIAKTWKQLLSIDQGMNKGDVIHRQWNITQPFERME